jgi:hypothetical protein
MNGPRMSAANQIGLKVFGDAGFRVLDTHRLTVGRRELAHPDGNHYWREGTTEEGVQLRIGACGILLACGCIHRLLVLFFLKPNPIMCANHIANTAPSSPSSRIAAHSPPGNDVSLSVGGLILNAAMLHFGV